MHKFKQEDLKAIHDIALMEMKEFSAKYCRLPEFSDNSTIRAYCYFKAVSAHLKNKGVLNEIPTYLTKTYVKV